MRAREFISEVMPLVGLARKSMTGRQAAQQAAKPQQGGTKSPQGTQGTQGTQSSANNQEPQDTDSKAQAALDAAKDKILKPGASIPLPTAKGKMQNFKVTKVQGDEVEIENPDSDKAPEQPEKIVYKKDDIKKSIQ